MIQASKPVKVYRNVRRGDWSVVQGGKVVAHVTTLYLRDATFHVNEAGRQRVLREQRKNVHAFVRGTPVGPVTTNEGWRLRGNVHTVRYHPYRGPDFCANDGTVPVTGAALVRLSPQGMVAVDPVRKDS